MNTLLAQATKKVDMYFVKRLFESGLHPSETYDKRGKTTLHHATKLYDVSKGLDIAAKLLSKESSLANAVDQKQRTPLHRAAFSGNARMCGPLFQQKTSVRLRDENG